MSIGIGINLALGVRLGGAGGFVPVFLLRDDFTTPASAPLASPRTAEPGPGMLAITDANNKLSIASGNLSFATGGVAAGNPGVRGAQLARRAGLAIVCRGNLGVNGMEIGWDDDGLALTREGFRFNSISQIRVGTVTLLVFTLATGVDYEAAIVQRSAGFFVFIKGGIFSAWTLIWVDDAEVSANSYPSAICVNTITVGTLDTLRVLDLPAPFNTDYALATQRTASPAADATITSEANADIEFTWSAVTGETVELSVRRTTDNDRWIIRGGQADSTVKLIEVVAGVETEHASAVQTWTNGTGYRIFVAQDGTTIRVYVANVLKITYSSASSNQSATGVKVNKAGAELIAWPRTLAGAVASVLDLAVA